METNCRRCMARTRATGEVCGKCKGELARLLADLYLIEDLKQYPGFRDDVEAQKNIND